jgi:circadian clock protein KaiC
MKTAKNRTAQQPRLLKAPTGINGLDEITGGGLPKGRPTLVAGNAGCGKTLLAMEFLVQGAIKYDKPGVFVAFEETPQDLESNFSSLGYDLPDLIRRRKLAIEYVYIERSEIEETGAYDLEGLFIRLAYAIDKVKAKRIVLDTIEVLFSGLTNTAILRAEIRRLFRWLKERSITAIVTGERGESGLLTRFGLEEYVADCVIMLDHRVHDQVSTRRLRVVKYRGSSHGTSEYPFLIDEKGISILPISSLGLQHSASTERIPTGIERLDAMLGGRGYYRGSSVLVSGKAGSGKTSLCAHFIDAACRRGERCVWLAYEESAEQIKRNMRSIGIDLEKWTKKGLLLLKAQRPSSSGLEMLLLDTHKIINQYKPSVIVVDPITNLNSVGTEFEITSTLMRLIDFFKMNKITALFTSLIHGGDALEQSEVGVSSLIDTWILLRDFESGISNQRNHGLQILKSRGMAHSNKFKEFIITDHGVELID